MFFNLLLTRTFSSWAHIRSSSLLVLSFVLPLFLMSASLLFLRGRTYGPNQMRSGPSLLKSASYRASIVDIGPPDFLFTFRFIT